MRAVKKFKARKSVFGTKEAVLKKSSPTKKAEMSAFLLELPAKPDASETDSDWTS